VNHRFRSPLDIDVASGVGFEAAINVSLKSIPCACVVGVGQRPFAPSFHISLPPHHIRLHRHGISSKILKSVLASKSAAKEAGEANNNKSKKKLSAMALTRRKLTAALSVVVCISILGR